MTNEAVVYDLTDRRRSHSVRTSLLQHDLEQGRGRGDVVQEYDTTDRGGHRCTVVLHISRAWELRDPDPGAVYIIPAERG
jgi:hypothetical protein